MNHDIHFTREFLFYNLTVLYVSDKTFFIKNLNFGLSPRVDNWYAHEYTWNRKIIHLKVVVNTLQVFKIELCMGDKFKAILPKKIKQLTKKNPQTLI